MNLFSQLQHYVFQYYGIDWIMMLTSFTTIFFLDEKKQLGFMMGMISCCFGLFFSFQIGSIANGFASTILFFLYLRGYMKWQKKPRVPRK